MQAARLSEPTRGALSKMGGGSDRGRKNDNPKGHPDFRAAPENKTKEKKSVQKKGAEPRADQVKIEGKLPQDAKQWARKEVRGEFSNKPHLTTKRKTEGKKGTL